MAQFVRLVEGFSTSVQFASANIGHFSSRMTFLDRH